MKLICMGVAYLSQIKKYKTSTYMKALPSRESTICDFYTTAEHKTYDIQFLLIATDT